MYDSPQSSSRFASGPMTLGERVSAAAEITKHHALTIFLTIVAGSVVIIILALIGFMVFGGIPAIISGGQSSVFSIIGIIIVYLALILMMQYFMVGVYSLILTYVDGFGPERGVLAEVLSPWRKPIFLCLVVWFLLSLAFQIVIGLLSLIPILGILINLAGSIFIAMVMSAAYFYLADQDRPAVGESIVTAFQVVAGNIVVWLLSMLIAVVVCLPGVVILTVIMALGAGSTAVMVFGVLFAFIYFVASFIFIFSLFGVTFRQTYGGSMKSVVEQVF